MSDVPDQNTNPEELLNAKIQYLWTIVQFFNFGYRSDLENVVPETLNRIRDIVSLSAEEENQLGEVFPRVFLKLCNLISKILTDEQILAFITDPIGKLAIKKIYSIVSNELTFEVTGLLHDKLENVLRAHIENLIFLVDSQRQNWGEYESNTIPDWFLSEFAIVSEIEHDRNETFQEMVEIRESFLTFYNAISLKSVLAIVRNVNALNMLRKMATVYDCSDDIKARIMKADSNLILW